MINSLQSQWLSWYHIYKSDGFFVRSLNIFQWMSAHEYRHTHTPFRNGKFQLKYRMKQLEMECFETNHNFFPNTARHYTLLYIINTAMNHMKHWRFGFFTNKLWLDQIWFQWIVSFCQKNNTQIRIIAIACCMPSKWSAAFEKERSGTLSQFSKSQINHGQNASRAED